MKDKQEANFSWFSLLSAFLCLCLISSCGYYFGQEGSLASRHQTITVPYVEGYQDGLLTAAIIKAIASSGLFEYRTSGGSLVLNVKLIDVDQDNIGFRYYRKKKGDLTRDVIPTETRIFGTIEVAVVEAASGSTVLGPARLSASVDYDHDYYSSRDGVNAFSLGQLTDLDEAFDAVQTPLHNSLAQKIVDYVGLGW